MINAKRSIEACADFYGDDSQDMKSYLLEGEKAALACASPVTKFVAPGPEVAIATPIFPDVLAYPWAACVAPCSCLVKI